MANAPASTTALPPVTEDAFIADRMAFWSSFTGATTASAVAIAVLLVLLLIFVV